MENVKFYFVTKFIKTSLILKISRSPFSQLPSSRSTLSHSPLSLPSHPVSILSFFRSQTTLIPRPSTSTALFFPFPMLSKSCGFHLFLKYWIQLKSVNFEVTYVFMSQTSSPAPSIPFLCFMVSTSPFGQKHKSKTLIKTKNSTFYWPQARRIFFFSRLALPHKQL